MICEAIVNRATVVVVRLDANVRSKLEDVINKALEKDLDIRYQDDSDIRTELRQMKR
jgi:hypothetical protein